MVHDPETVLSVVVLLERYRTDTTVSVKPGSCTTVIGKDFLVSDSCTQRVMFFASSLTRRVRVFGRPDLCELTLLLGAF